MNPHIAIAGPSAAGKSVICKSLASLFDAQYICSSKLLLQVAIDRKLLSSDVLYDNNFWLSDNARKFNKLRLADTGIDEEANKQLLSLINTNIPQVIDSLSYPFLHNENHNLVKLYLTANLDERINRANMENAKHDKVLLGRELVNKDRLAKLIFNKIWNVELYSKNYLTYFDIVFDNSRYTFSKLEPGQPVVWPETLTNILTLCGNYFLNQHNDLSHVFEKLVQG